MPTPYSSVIFSRLDETEDPDVAIFFLHCLQLFKVEGTKVLLTPSVSTWRNAGITIVHTKSTQKPL